MFLLALIYLFNFCWIFTNTLDIIYNIYNLNIKIERKNLDNKNLYIFYFFNLKQWKQFLEKDILLNNNFQIIIYKDRGGMLIKIQPHNHIDL